MTPEEVFVDAAKMLKVCMLTDTAGNSRVIEPYMVYTSSKGKILFHCYQLEGYSERGNPQGWKNPEVATFISARASDQSFTPRPEYNPFNTKMFPEVHFAIPTNDGRQR